MRPRSLPRPILLALGAAAVLVFGPPPAARSEDARGGLVVEGLEQRDDGVYLLPFGEAGQEEELDAVVTVRNAGDVALTGLRAVGDCGCYGVEIAKPDLAPGERTTVSVKFRTLMMSGIQTKRLRLYHDGSPDRATTIRLQVDIVAGVVVEPHRFFFEHVLVGSRPEATVVVKWREGVGRPFAVTGVDVGELDLHIEKRPYEEDGWKGTAIALRFKSPPPLGLLSDTALIHTDHPDYPRITLALTANVTGRVQVQSRVVWMGWVRRGTSRRATILVRPYDDTVDLGTVTATSRHGKVDVAVRRAPPGPDPGWIVEVAARADAPVGRLDDVVEVHTGVKGEEVTEIEVRGQVIEGADHGE